MKLSDIIALTNVVKAKCEKDTVVLSLTNGITLSIYNKTDMDEFDLQSLVGQRVKAVDEQANKIDIIFAPDKAVLTIGLEDQHYNGPEALQVILENGQRFVWP